MLLIVEFDTYGVTARGRSTWVPVSDVVNFLDRLQKTFNEIASSQEPILGQLLRLPKRQRAALFHLQVTGKPSDTLTRVYQLHLLINPDYGYAATLQDHAIQEALRSAFVRITASMIEGANAIGEGKQYQLTGSLRRALRNFARQLRPNSMKIGINLGILSTELNYDWGQRVQDSLADELIHEQRLTEDSIIDEEAVLIAPIEPPEGPYVGKVVVIIAANRVLVLQCDDYSEPTPCHYDSSQNEIIAHLRAGELVSIWGVPIRDASHQRHDKPPKMLTHVHVVPLVQPKSTD